jgi:hypothetical protein
MRRLIAPVLVAGLLSSCAPVQQTVQNLLRGGGPPIAANTSVTGRTLTLQLGNRSGKPQDLTYYSCLSWDVRRPDGSVPPELAARDGRIGPLDELCEAAPRTARLEAGEALELKRELYWAPGTYVVKLSARVTLNPAVAASVEQNVQSAPVTVVLP